MKSLARLVAVVGSQPVKTPSLLGSTLKPGCSDSAFVKPVWRSVSAGWPAMPRVYQIVPFAWPLASRYLNSQVAPR